MSNEDNKTDNNSEEQKYASLYSSSSFFGDNLQHRNEALNMERGSMRETGTSHKLSMSEEGFEEEDMEISIKSTTVYNRYEQDQDSDDPFRFEDFKVINPIGKGTFGKVYLVHCQKDGNFYAMKGIRKDMIIDHDSIANLKLEK